MFKLAELKIGECGYIYSIGNHHIQLQLLNMGCMPKSAFEVVNIAPLGDPIAIKVGNTVFSIRKHDASYIQIEKENKKI